MAAVCTLAALGGNALAGVSGAPMQAGINGFAAGALLVMLSDEMIPEARRKAKDYAGLATVLGFAVAAGLSASRPEPLSGVPPRPPARRSRASAPGTRSA